MAIGGAINLTSKIIKQALAKAGRAPVRRPVADFGRLPQKQKISKAYKESQERAYDEYKKRFFEQYEQGLPPHLQRPSPTPQQPEFLPVQMPPRRPVSDPRVPRPRPNSPAPQSQSRRPQDLPEFAEPFAEPGLRLPLNVQPQPRPVRPLRRPLPSQRSPLENIKRGLSDLVFPGLNEVSDWLADKTLEGINNLTGLGEKQEPRPEPLPDSPPPVLIPDPPNNQPIFTAPVPDPSFPQLPPQTYPPNTPPPPGTQLTRITIKYGYNRSQSSITYNALEGGRTSTSSWVSPPSNRPSVWTFYSYGIPKLGSQTNTYAWQPSGGSGAYNILSYGATTYLTFESWQQNTRGEAVYVRYTTGISVSDYVAIAPNSSYSYAGSASSLALIVYDVEIDPPQQTELETPEPSEIIILNPSPNPEEDMSCDLSPLQAILRMQQNQIVNLQTTVANANLEIRANIDSLKPPINQTNTTVQSISAKADDLISSLTNVRDIANATGTKVTNVANTVNSTATTVQNVSTKVDDLASGLTNVRDIARATGTKVDDVGNVVRNTADKVDDVGNVVRNTADKVDDVGRNLGNVGNRVNDIWNKIGEHFTKTMERFDKLAKWLRLPLIFDALSLIVVLHNAAMLSSNLVQTLGQIIDTALDIFNLKDDNQEGFSIAEILGKQANEFMASIVGQQTWTQTTTTWKKLNNIYQAAANVIYSMQSIIDSTRSIMELGAEMTGKIGNALRAAGVVFENAFNWFPEQINAATARQTKLNGMIQGIQNIDDTASSLASAVSSGKSIQDEVIEMRKQRQEFNQAVSELVGNKSTQESENKAKSKSPTINNFNLSGE